ncbi:type I-E CRISPR-associated protein Cse2/CasB [Marinitenerispora sediminis]|uniref:Type I-E CRISPR-associated protein Cse2/CasB n=1 Tax=Marinitenerispora sediminis TaxID=1931232 RepID=A0A368T5S5_9ACTN|nr:type I-E CRISPR-associated protein Cse2/CasB [Marinitenerispora sediminis]RCV51383.1 type I-E CRISPR-associated protein Cse2/CasB [Marinitenerispora sediminis]RCV55086.1 type I-E CRISPR-associated protein Cse2/CasB [Marinitenerispora sediminis]RCV58108.1 type I-E CRISPR-associated protein Cse2/CasB [Marinitenerispora sediminis]
MNQKELIAVGDRMTARIRHVIENDPGLRAALRRGIGRPPKDIANFHAHAVVAPFLPERPDHATERAFYTVAALIAAQQRGARDQDVAGSASDGHEGAEGGPTGGAGTAAGRSRRRNLGETLAWAVEKGRVNGDAARDRLHLLARYRVDRLHRELPKLISYLRADLIPVDWGYLLRDLARWGSERDQVAKEWVQRYHRTRDDIQRERKRRADDESPAAADTTIETEDQLS